VEKIAFKIPHGFASYLVRQREQRSVYQTNRAVKVYGFFSLLKTITSTGIIKNYHQQITDISQLTKRSTSSVYAYIGHCKKLGLLTTEGRNIQLTGWKAIINKHDECVYTPIYTTLQYDPANELQTAEYMIYAAEIAENQQKQTKAVIKSIGNNLLLAEALNVKQTTTKKDVETLQRLQVLTFVSGKTDPDYELIHSLNADVQRTAKTLRKAYGMKSRRTVKYLKKQLIKRGIAKVEKRLLQSPDCSRVNKSTYYTGYNPANKNTFWKRPDSINLLCA